MPEPTTAPVAASVTTPVSTAPVASAVSQRLMSLDALRGFDMFWITAAEGLFTTLAVVLKNIWPMPFITTQLEHCEWEGFHFEDFIFPLFVFMMGVSAVFSLTKLLQQEGRPAAVKRIIRRSVLMFILALIYSGGFSKPWPDMRLMGVLNRIALCYFFGALIFIFFKPKAIVGIAAALLLGYWALLALVPFPDVRPTPGVGIINRTNAPTLDKLNMASTTMIHGTYIQGVNLTDYLDMKYLPGRKYDGTYDPEGFLSTIPAIVTCLLGIFAGLLMKNTNVCPTRKVVYLLSFGVAGVLLGYLWGTQFPIIKKIWSSSYVLVAGGYSAIALGIFYWVVDVMKFQWWCQPFVWMGMNSITIYIIHGFVVSFGGLSKRLVGGSIQNFLNNEWAGLGDFMIYLVAAVLVFWFLHFLYRRKIFLRL